MRRTVGVVLALSATLSTALYGAAGSVESTAKYIINKNPKLTQAASMQIAESVHKYAGEYNLKPELVLALCWVESRFNPRAKSDKGALGLMQVHYPSWRRELLTIGISNREELFDIELGIRAGCHVLSLYVSNSEDILSALDGYLGERNRAYRRKVMTMTQEAAFHLEGG